MSIRRVVGVLFLAAGVCLAEEAALRTWTDNRGRTIEARLLKTQEAAVLLETADGRRATVPLANLSPADRQYVAGRGKDETAPASPPAPPAPPPVAKEPALAVHDGGSMSLALPEVRPRGSGLEACVYRALLWQGLRPSRVDISDRGVEATCANSGLDTEAYVSRRRTRRRDANPLEPFLEWTTARIRDGQPVLVWIRGSVWGLVVGVRPDALQIEAYNGGVEGARWVGVDALVGQDSAMRIGDEPTALAITGWTARARREVGQPLHLLADPAKPGAALAKVQDLTRDQRYIVYTLPDAHRTHGQVLADFVADRAWYAVAVPLPAPDAPLVVRCGEASSSGKVRGVVFAKTGEEQ